jgi:phosphatidylserine/phosphatidylglycerophosphate/cardiolipin synthase-like enzyme
MLLADGERAIVGSINFSPGSFDSRRELAIEVDDRHVVKALHRIAKHDWEHSHKLDLSDEGLLADLAKRGGAAAAAERLAVEGGKSGRDGKRGKGMGGARRAGKARPKAAAAAKRKRARRR